MADDPIAVRWPSTVLAIFFLTAWMPMVARADPVAHFHAGVEAYGKGDYVAAARAFERARAEGLDRPALYYNLGSAYYRLGDYGRASDSFRHLLSDPELAALAHYNLGLVAKRQGSTAAARAHFRAAYDAGRDERLRYLAQRQLGGSAAEPAAAPLDWRAYASLGAGYDDNVNFAPTDMPTYRGDSFGEVYVSASGVLSGSRRDGASVHGSLYGLRYQDDTENDFSALRLLARKNAAFGDWRTYAGGFASHDTLGGAGYQRALGIETAARRELQQDRYVYLQYVYETIDSLDRRYDYLTGQRHDLLAEYEIYQSRGSVRVGYELELNDRRDTAFESYSPTRHTVRADYRYDLDADWRLRADASYRWSEYPDAPLLDREDKRWRTRLSASRQLAADWSLTGQWEYTDNRSSDPLRDYQRQVYSLQLEWLF